MTKICIAAVIAVIISRELREWYKLLKKKEEDKTPPPSLFIYAHSFTTGTTLYIL
jgi:hypothetical protein